MRLRGRTLVAAVVLALSGPLPVLAQGAVDTPVQSSFVVIDQEALFDRSLFGLRVMGEIETESRLLAEENRRLEEALTTEERSLTERRAGLDPAEFRALADEFDARVTAIRVAQDRKARSLTQREDVERRRFLNSIVPVLGQILNDFGAMAVLDRRTVFLSDDRIDITERAIAEIDALIGDGGSQLLDAPATGQGAAAAEEP